MSRSRDISWDEPYFEEPDPIPPSMAVPPCRSCLGTSVMLDRLPDGTFQFTSGCDHCGKGYVAVDE